MTMPPSKYLESYAGQKLVMVHRADLEEWAAALQHLPPDDDSSPIDEAFLLSIGFRRDEGDRENELSIGDFDTRQCLCVLMGTEQWSWMAMDRYDYTPKAILFAEDNPVTGDLRLRRIPSAMWPKTRGAVRRLLAVLGVGEGK